MVQKRKLFVSLIKKRTKGKIMLRLNKKIKEESQSSQGSLHYYDNKIMVRNSCLIKYSQINANKSF